MTLLSSLFVTYSVDNNPRIKFVHGSQHIEATQQKIIPLLIELELMRNLMTHAQKPVFVFRLNGRVHLNRQGSQFSRLLVAEVCASALVMLDTLRPEVV